MRYRKPASEDMDQIYLMGFDVWGDGDEESAYLELCRTSAKYKLGEWWCLDLDGKVVSSLIIYRNAWDLMPGYVGIGSVATALHHRRQGYASSLIKRRVHDFKQSGVKGVYLFSDIDPEMYTRLGFTLVPGYAQSGLMFLRLSGDLQETQPKYF